MSTFGLAVGVEVKGELYRHAVRLEEHSTIGDAYKKLVVWCYERKFGGRIWK